MLDRSHQEAERRLTSGSRPVNIWEAWDTVTDAVSEPLRVDCVWQLCGWGSVCDDANAKAAKCAHRQAVKKSVLSYLTSTLGSVCTESLALHLVAMVEGYLPFGLDGDAVWEFDGEVRTSSVRAILARTFVSALVLEGSHDTSMPEYTF
ncbi:MAG: hypothetical protein ACKVHU_09105 [Acidimicrobiales bacterium]